MNQEIIWPATWLVRMHISSTRDRCCQLILVVCSSAILCLLLEAPLLLQCLLLALADSHVRLLLTCFMSVHDYFQNTPKLCIRTGWAIDRYIIWASTLC